MFTGLKTAGDLPTILAVTAGIFTIAAAVQIYFYCIKRAPVHRVITVANASPVWTVLLAMLFLGEKITLLLPFSLALVIGGSFMLVPQKKGPNNWRPAIPLAILVSVLWGLDRVLRKLAINAGMDALTFVWISVISATLLLNFMAGTTRSWNKRPISRLNVGLSVVSAFSSHLVGTFLYMFALQLESVSLLEPFVSVTIPFGFLLSVLIIHERPNKRALIGMVVVFLGVVLAAL